MMMMRVAMLLAGLGQAVAFGGVGSVALRQPLRLYSSATDGATGALQRPPASFAECISQAQAAVTRALADGFRLVEVEFPPLPVALMEDVSSSADDIMKANVNLVVDFAQRFAVEGKVVLIYPDTFEATRAQEILGTSSPGPNLSIHNLRRTATSTAVSFDGLLAGIFGKRAGELSLPEKAAYYVCLGFSAQELPDVEELHAANPDVPIIGFNLKLDAARGDLGLPAFPSRALHNRFLSRFKPAYLLRTRSYALSLPRPPFVLSYQGALFRSYPEAFQTLLDVGDGRYKAVEVDAARPALGVFKDQLTNALQLGANEDLNSVLGRMRKGVVNKTWWERLNDDEEETDWRT